MPVREVLILAVTKMLGGVCHAGMTTEPHPVTVLRWVRPVREHGHVLLGDITTSGGTVLRPFDVIEINLLRPRPIPPHTEDWITDFVYLRPRIVRRLECERRAQFLSRHLDTAPRQVLEGRQRSLCLIRPDWIKGYFQLDSHSGRFDARLSFGLDGRSYTGSRAQGGFSVTDLKWCALGRAWLRVADESRIVLDPDVLQPLGIQAIYLTVGLTRSFKGGTWIIVVGVHTVPDYQAVVDYDDI
jgi:hypothetical protein